MNPELLPTFSAMNVLYSGRDGSDDDEYDPSKVLLRGYADSTVPAFAEFWGYKFEAIEDDGTGTEETAGNINDDGVLNLYDVIEIAKSLIGMRTFTDEEKLIADYNHDGVVNLYDAIEVARTIMENIKES